MDEVANILHYLEKGKRFDGKVKELKETVSSFTPAYNPGSKADMLECKRQSTDSPWYIM